MAVHKALASFRTGRQEFFKVDIELARKTIVQECARIDLETNARAEVESKLRRDADIAEQRARAERFAEARRLRDAEVAARQSQQISADLSTTEDREAEAVARQPDARNIESEQSGWPVSFLFLLLLVLGLLALGKATRPADAPSESVPAHYSVSPSPSAAAVLTTAEAERRQPQSEEPKGSTSEVAMKSEEQRLRHVAIKALEIQARRDAEAASDMRVIQDRALQDYPLLGTPAGRPIWEKMIQRRDELVKQGVYPSIAMTRAVQAFAPELPLTDASSMRSIVVPEPNAEQRSKDDSCRWNTPTSWKCD